MFKEIFENKLKLKVGDVIKFKPEFEDSNDDGTFKIVELNGDRGMVQSTKSKLKIPQTSLFKIEWVQKVVKVS